MLRLYLGGVLLTALTGCQHRSSASQVSVISLAYEPPETCRVTLDRRSFMLPSDEAALLASLTQQAQRYRTARVAGDVTIPYKCFGFAVFEAQRAGFKRVTFQAEPPATNP